MARKTLIRSNVFPYHVTARTNNKELFPIPIRKVWEIIIDELLLLHILFKIEVQSFVLMPNHMHLILTTPQEDLGKVMNLFMADVTRISHKFSGRSGHLFGGPYFWSIITSTRYYGHVFKYVYRNPVKANLCEKVEEYEFSTLGGIIGLGRAHIPLHFTRLGMEMNLPETENEIEWLKWLNTPFPKEAEELIQMILRKREIQEIVNPKTRYPSKLLSQLL